ncbi:glutamate--tRNA ligase-like isoform X2 [Corticium candelabrum]|nr:glutamate--tRNA ligase-like isoform X2 [Corticium candelabrum]
MRVPSTGTVTYSDLVYGTMEFHAHTISDQILIKSDGYPSYHLASIVDDHHMGVTHVLRGEEWLSSTPKHVMLYHAFGWPMPLLCHLPLLMNSDGTKMSKRDSHMSVGECKEMGILPAALLNFVAHLGWSPDDHTLRYMTFDELVDQFSLGGINKARPTVDVQQLLATNRWHLRAKHASADEEEQTEFVNQLRDLVIHNLGVDPVVDINGVSRDYLEAVLGLLLSRVSTVPEVVHAGRYFWLDPVVSSVKLIEIYPTARELIMLTVDELNSLENRDFCAVEVMRLLRQIASDCGVSRKAVLQVVRFAVTGMNEGPELGLTVEVLGRERVTSRLLCHV